MPGGDESDSKACCDSVNDSLAVVAKDSDAAESWEGNRISLDSVSISSLNCLLFLVHG